MQVSCPLSLLTGMKKRDHFLQLTSGMTLNWQLGFNALQLPSLPPEKCSMTGLHLLQQLYKLFKYSDVKPCDPTKVTASLSDSMMSCSLQRGWGKMPWLKCMYHSLWCLSRMINAHLLKMFTQWYLPSVVFCCYPVSSAGISFEIAHVLPA